MIPSTTNSQVSKCITILIKKRKICEERTHKACKLGNMSNDPGITQVIKLLCNDLKVEKIITVKFNEKRIITANYASPFDCTLHMSYSTQLKIMKTHKIFKLWRPLNILSFTSLILFSANILQPIAKKDTQLLSKKHELGVSVYNPLSVTG